MRTLVFIFALVLSSSALAQEYTDGRGNIVVPDARTQRAINEAKALRGKYYADKYGNDGVTVMRDGTLYHFNQNDNNARGKAAIKRANRKKMKSLCGGLRPMQKERCIQDYFKNRQKPREQYQN